MKEFRGALLALLLLGGLAAIYFSGTQEEKKEVEKEGSHGRVQMAREDDKKGKEKRRMMADGSAVASSRLRELLCAWRTANLALP